MWFPRTSWYNFMIQSIHSERCVGKGSSPFLSQMEKNVLKHNFLCYNVNAVLITEIYVVNISIKFNDMNLIITFNKENYIIKN